MPKLAFDVTSLTRFYPALGVGEPSLSELLETAKKDGVQALVSNFARADNVLVASLRKSTKLPLFVESEPEHLTDKALLKLSPKLVCVVASKASATANGGLDLKKSSKSLASGISHLKKSGIKVALSLDPDAATLRLARGLGVGVVQLCASGYSRAASGKKQEALLEDLCVAGLLVRELGMGLHVSGALDYSNAEAIAQMPELEFVSVGDAIVGKTMEVGFSAACAQMVELLGAQEDFVSAPF